MRLNILSYMSMNPVIRGYIIYYFEKGFTDNVIHNLLGVSTRKLGVFRKKYDNNKESFLPLMRVPPKFIRENEEDALTDDEDDDDVQTIKIFLDPDKFSACAAKNHQEYLQARGFNMIQAIEKHLKKLKTEEADEKELQKWVELQLKAGNMILAACDRIPQEIPQNRIIEIRDGHAVKIENKDEQ